MSAPNDARAAADAFVAAMGSGDFDQVRAVFTDDVTWWVNGSLPMSGEYRGKEAVMVDFLGSALPLFESLGFTVTNIFVGGDQALVEWHAQGRAANGKPYDSRYAFVLRARGNQVASVREYPDTEYVRATLLSD